MKMNKNTALIVIDVQDSFYHAPYWDDQNLKKFSQNINQIISHARSREWPIVHVLHNQDDGSHFDPASGHVKTMDWVDRQEQDLEFNKHCHNALTGSGLLQWLQDNKITNLLISGIRTEQCCETTARVASDLSFKVDFVTDATLTFPMTHPTTNNVFSPKEIKEKTELVLVNRFAKITSTADYATT